MIVHSLELFTIMIYKRVSSVAQEIHNHFPTGQINMKEDRIANYIQKANYTLGEKTAFPNCCHETVQLQQRERNIWKPYLIGPLIHVVQPYVYVSK